VERGKGPGDGLAPGEDPPQSGLGCLHLREIGDGGILSGRIIHESRLLQMRGVTHAAVVVHRKWVTTKQPTHPTQPSWLARRVKNADGRPSPPLNQKEIWKIYLEKFFQQYQDNFLLDGGFPKSVLRFLLVFFQDAVG